MINKILRIAKSATNRNKKLQGICDLLKNDVDHYDWVGFYLADADKHELILGPYAGAATEHTNIKFGSGICGQGLRIDPASIVVHCRRLRGAVPKRRP